MQLNMSAQYGNSAGSINNLVTKSGTQFLSRQRLGVRPQQRARCEQLFLEPAGSSKNPPLRFNQFGGTFGGALIKDKLFFFGSYQGDRFTTSGTPQTITVESPAWRHAVIAAQPNSVAALLYQNFSPAIAGSQLSTLNSYAPATDGNSSTDPNVGRGARGNARLTSRWLCPDFNNRSMPAASRWPRSWV